MTSNCFSIKLEQKIFATMIQSLPKGSQLSEHKQYAAIGLEFWNEARCSYIAGGRSIREGTKGLYMN